LLKKHFIDRLSKYDVHIIAGNHDVFYRSTNKINALQLLINDSCNVYIEPTEIVVEQVPVLLLPWINQENHQRSMDAINTTRSDLCFGHLEIAGFEMFKGAVCDHGLTHSIFNKFDMVLSGHFHHKSSRSNIHYLGSPYQMTWSDYDFDRGFHVMDLSTRQLKFIRNPSSMFWKFVYDDALDSIEHMTQKIEGARLEGKICKIDVINKHNPYQFDVILDKISSSTPFDIKINTTSSAVYADEEGLEQNVENTQTLIFKAIDQIETHHDKNALKKMMGELYLRALDIEVNL